MAMGFTTRESARQVLEAYESDDDVARGKLRMLRKECHGVGSPSFHPSLLVMPVNIVDGGV
jgi:hypothetical protein